MGPSRRAGDRQTADGKSEIQNPKSEIASMGIFDKFKQGLKKTTQLLNTDIRDLFKGTYEHADTFIQRDVNPVGLWGDVTLTFYSQVRLAGKPAVDVHLTNTGQAEVRIACPLFVGDGDGAAVGLRCRILDEATGITVARTEMQAVSADLYSQAKTDAPGQGTPAPDAGENQERGEDNQAGQQDKDDVIDADFEMVDDKK